VVQSGSAAVVAAGRAEDQCRCCAGAYPLHGSGSLPAGRRPQTGRSWSWPRSGVKMPALILAGRRGVSPRPGYLRRIAASCRTAGSRPTGYGRGRPLHHPAGPRQTSMMPIPGPQGLRQAPGHPPAQEPRAGIGHPTLPGQSVAGSRAQVEHQILPDRFHLMHAATVMAQVGDVCHWAPARENGPREQATKNSGPSPQPRRVAAAAARVRSNTPTVPPRRARRQGKPTQIINLRRRTPHVRSDHLPPAARAAI
jgi:hypothetical protein